MNLKIIPTEQFCSFSVVNNKVLITSENSQISFCATKDNYALEVLSIQNGSEQDCTEPFLYSVSNGEQYIIRSMKFYDDMLGETSCRFRNCFCYLCLKIESGSGECYEIHLESDIIHLEMHPIQI